MNRISIWCVVSVLLKIKVPIRTCRMSIKKTQDPDQIQRREGFSNWQAHPASGRDLNLVLGCSKWVGPESCRLLLHPLHVSPAHPTVVGLSMAERIALSCRSLVGGGRHCCHLLFAQFFNRAATQMVAQHFSRLTSTPTCALMA